MRAVRCIQSGDVARSYLDPLAIRLQSIRMGKTGQGWRRFLVFAELTKSKKGADYIALFTYYSFEAWLRVCFAEGPRQALNAITLYSVMQLNLIPEGKHAATDGHSAVVQFFYNIEALAEKNQQQAVVLSGMLFTLVIWVFSMLSFISSIILYLLFLWHHIPNHDGTLRRYCRRKINRRLQRIVGLKINKALKKEEQLKQRQNANAAKGKDGEAQEGKKFEPTLPVLDDSKEPTMPALSRVGTAGTLPPYTSRPGTADSSMRPPNRPFLPTRTTTQSSAASYGSNAPLLTGASDMGYGPPGSEESLGRPSLDRTMTGGSQFTQRSYGGRPAPSPVPEEPMPGMMQRSMTAQSLSNMSQRSFTAPGGPMRPPTAQGRGTPGPPPPGGPNGAYPMNPIQRPGTAMSNTSTSSRRPYGPPSGDPLGRRGPPGPPLDTQGRASPGPGMYPNGPASNSSASLLRNGTPGPSPMGAQSRSGTPASAGGYKPFSPDIPQTTTPAPMQQSTFQQPMPPRQPHRNMTDPYAQSRVGTPQSLAPFNAPPLMRSGTAPPTQMQQQYRAPPPRANSGYDDSIYDSYASPESSEPPRPTTTTPNNGSGNVGGGYQAYNAQSNAGQGPASNNMNGTGNGYAAFRFD